MVLGQKNSITDFIKSVQEAIEKKWTRLEFFLDLTKAYDVLNHKVLLSKNETLMLLEVWQTYGLNPTYHTRNNVWK
jgi:hypothetical protein